MHRFGIAVLLAGLATAAAPAPTIAASADVPARHVARSVAFAPREACRIDAEVLPDARPAVLADVDRRWDSERRAAFARLLAAADAFGRTVAANEIDRSEDDPCQARAAALAERRAFIRTLETVVADAAPDTALLTFREADGALNAAYREIMAVDDPGNLAWGSVDKSGIRRTERAWLAYRDAFVAFAATFDQPDAAERVKIELTARRATSLEAFLAD